MSNIRFDYSKALPFVGQHEIDNMAEYVKEAHNMLHNKTGAGNDFLGWVNLTTDYDKEEFARIKKAAEKIRSDSDVLVVIGIGGSYLGARAAVEMLQHSFPLLSFLYCQINSRVSFPSLSVQTSSALLPALTCISTFL